MITSIIIFGAVILSVGVACATSDDDSTIDPNEIKTLTLSGKKDNLIILKRYYNCY